MMPSAPDNHDAYDYAERIRERLPRRLQETREAARLSMYGLARESGLSREYLGKLERGALLKERFLGVTGAPEESIQTRTL